jgi:hypothetical protein
MQIGGYLNKKSSSRDGLVGGPNVAIVVAGTIPTMARLIKNKNQCMKII